MTNLCEFAPIMHDPASRLTALIAGDGVQALDITGPASVFAAANDTLKRRQRGDFYDVRVLSPARDAIQTNSAVSFKADELSSVSGGEVDTVLIGGHEKEGTLALLNNQALKSWMECASKSARRWGSVCSGALILGGWGLLAGKRAATHWSDADALEHLSPDIKVDSDALYVVDGNLWTSAGVTAGIDMALAMVEQVIGAEIASEIAQRLVVYLRRPGSQAQYSSVLKGQRKASETYGALIEWARENLDKDLSIEVLSTRAGQTRRTFQRRFSEVVGQSPAAFIEDLRLERAMALLSAGGSLKSVAAETGFSTPARLASVFQRRYKVTPAHWRRMHSTAASAL